MKEMYVVAYYGSLYSKVFTHHGWKDLYIGEGIVHESEPIYSYPLSPHEYVEDNAPRDKDFKYAKIEKRFYPEEQEHIYTVDFYSGLQELGQELKYYKTVTVTSKIKLSNDEVEKEAYKLVGAIPKSHTIKIYEC